MRRTSRPLLLASGLALGVAAASSIVTTSAAQNLEPVLEKIALPREYVLLDTAADQVVFGDQTQSISEGCGLTSAELLSPSGTLLSIDAQASRDRLGYGKNGIGVAGNKDKSGTKCADVDADLDQALVVSLGSDVPYVASAADLDIEFKFDGALEVTASRNGAPVSVTTAGGPGEASDDGPDSGDGDNYRVLVTADSPSDYFDTLVLTATSGSFALEGGGDGTEQSSLLGSTSASVFELVVADGLLKCDVNDADGVTENGVQVIFTDCQSGEVVPYLLDREQEAVGDNTRDRVLLGVPESQDNTYIVRIPWEPEAAQIPLPATEVAFFTLDGAPQYQAIDWCGVVEGSTTPVQPYLPADQDVLAEFEGAQGACLISQNAAIGEGDGEVQIIERILLVGDPAFGRLR